MTIGLPGQVQVLAWDYISWLEGVVAGDVLAAWLTDWGVRATILHEIGVFCVDVNIGAGWVAEWETCATRVEHVGAVEPAVGISERGGEEE